MTPTTVINLDPWIVAMILVVVVSVVALRMTGIHLWGRKSAEQQQEVDFHLGRESTDAFIRKHGIDGLVELERKLSDATAEQPLNAFQSGMLQSIKDHRFEATRAARLEKESKESC